MKMPVRSQECGVRESRVSRVFSNMLRCKWGGFAMAVVVLLCPSSAACISGADWQMTGPNTHEDVGADSYTTAYLNITYTDPLTRRLYTEKSELGKFGDGRVGSATGVLVHVTSWDGDHTGCAAPLRSTWGSGALPREPWIALVKRGNCNFEVKVENAFRHNATAVLVYNDRESQNLDKMKLSSGTRNMSAVFTYKWKGESLARMVDNGSRVILSLSVATHCTRPLTHINRTSVLFVSISFVVLMLISIAWLVFYYVQRFRYIHAKDRLSRRLCSAAKKALSKIPTKQIQMEDKEMQGEGECCAVCIEPYRVTDDLRILPCRHEFHKSCIDPWLLEHRTCPMCKMDILKHYGFVFTGSQESILQVHEDRLEGADNADLDSLRIPGLQSGVRSEPVTRVSTPDISASQAHGPCCTKCCAGQNSHSLIKAALMHTACPDTTQLLDSDIFYDMQSSDSNASTPVHQPHPSHSGRRSASCNDLKEVVVVGRLSEEPR